MNYRVGQLAEILNVRDYNHRLSDVVVLHVETDSRYVMHPESSVFFALQGLQKDGHAFINESIEKGKKLQYLNSKIAEKRFIRNRRYS